MIIDACVRDRTYESYDSSRTYYLSLALDHVGESALPDLFSSLRGRTDNKHTSQAQQILCELAFRRNPIAKAWVEENWERRLRQGDTTLAGGRLLWTGEPGYREALDALVHHWRKRRKEVSRGSEIHSCAQDLLGEKITDALQAEVLDANPWLDEVGDFPVSWDRRRVDVTEVFDIPFEEALNATNLALYKWARETSEEELQKVAEFLVQCEDPALMQKWLRVFWRRDYPRDLQELIDWTGNENRRVAWVAYIALERYSDPRIRGLALAKMDNLDFGCRAVNLLAKNFEPSDEKLIYRRFKRSFREEPHSMGFAILDVFEANPDFGLDSVRLSYEKNPCAFCRGRAWNWLEERSALTAEMLEEGQYDSDDGTRQSARSLSPHALPLPAPSRLVDEAYYREAS